MSNNGFTEILSVLMESDIDSARQAAITSGKLTDSLLAGGKIYTAASDDPPFVKKGQLGVAINTDNMKWIMVVMANEPTAILSSRYNWVHTNKKFDNWADLLPAESQGKAAPGTHETCDITKDTLETVENIFLGDIISSTKDALETAGAEIIKGNFLDDVNGIISFMVRPPGAFRVSYEGYIDTRKGHWALRNMGSQEIVAGGVETKSLWALLTHLNEGPTSG